jgi:hypothetical protein
VILAPGTASTFSFDGVYLPAGFHTVRIKYNPWIYEITFGASILGTGMVLLFRRYINE